MIVSRTAGRQVLINAIVFSNPDHQVLEILLHALKNKFSASPILLFGLGSEDSVAVNVVDCERVRSRRHQFPSAQRMAFSNKCRNSAFWKSSGWPSDV